MSMIARFGALGGKPVPIFVSSSVSRVSATTNAVPAPAGIINGDLLIAVIFNTSESSDPITLPTGWSRVYEDDTVTNYVVLATKIASSESGSYTFGFGASAANSINILVYRNATRINTIGSLTRINGSTVTATSITPTFRGVLCVAFGSESNTSVGTAPVGLTVRASELSSNPSLEVYELSSQEAVATSTYSITWGGAKGDLIAFQFQVVNESSVTPEFVASASTQVTTSTQTLTIDKPVGTQENDLMIAVMSSSTASATWTGDTGWTEVADQGSSPDLRIAYKVAGASEGSSYNFTLSSSTNVMSGAILTYRNADYDTIGAFTTGANPLGITSMSPTQSQSLVIAAIARGAAAITITAPTSMTARVTDNDATSPSFIICDQVAPKGPTGLRYSTTGSSTAVAGILISIKPTRSLS